MCACVCVCVCVCVCDCVWASVHMSLWMGRNECSKQDVCQLAMLECVLVCACEWVCVDVMMCDSGWGGLLSLLNYQLIASYNFIAFPLFYRE